MAQASRLSEKSLWGFSLCISCEDSKKVIWSLCGADKKCVSITGKKWKWFGQNHSMSTKVSKAVYSQYPPKLLISLSIRKICLMKEVLWPSIFLQFVLSFIVILLMNVEWSWLYFPSSVTQTISYHSECWARQRSSSSLIDSVGSLGYGVKCLSHRSPSLWVT